MIYKLTFLLILALFISLGSGQLYAQTVKYDLPATNTTPSKQEKDTTTQVLPQTNPLERTFDKNHDVSQKSYLRGTIYNMTGFKASAKDSLKLEGFSFNEKIELDSTMLAELSTLFSDTSNYIQRKAQPYRVYAPALGLFLETSKGNFDSYTFAFDSKELGLLDKNKKLHLIPVSEKMATELDKLYTSVFKKKTNINLQVIVPKKEATATKKTVAPKKGGLQFSPIEINTENTDKN